MAQTDAQDIATLLQGLANTLNANLPPSQQGSQVMQQTQQAQQQSQSSQQGSGVQVQVQTRQLAEQLQELIKAKCQTEMEKKAQEMNTRTTAMEKELQDMKTRMTAMEKNCEARVFNSSINERKTPLAPLVKSTNEPIPNFPYNLAVLHGYNKDQIAALLTECGLDSTGLALERRLRFREYIGVVMFLGGAPEREQEEYFAAKNAATTG
ncbi:hypothetical protein MMC30_001170 [Trapelia coarctata]|nr:hypothetical protein [Trapelia coarctata]